MCKSIHPSIHPSIHLSIISESLVRCKQLQAKFACQSSVQVLSVGSSETDIYVEAGKKVFQTNLIVIDLNHATIPTTQFWVSLNLLYPAVRKIGLVAEPFNRSLLRQALQAGVYCFANWEDAPGLWLEAAGCALAGRRFYATPMLLQAAQQAADGLAGWAEANPATAEVESAPSIKLTKRQRQVLDLLVAGQSNKEIAARLGVSKSTVEQHMWRIYAALGVTNRVEACLIYLNRKNEQGD